MPEEVVRAAGGVVWRPDGSASALPAGEVEVLLVHRPKYDDWTFPKGKAEPGEADEDCAVREVTEETGLRCELGAELPTTEYRDRFGRAKRVRYWAMRRVAGSFSPGQEVDDVVWMPPPEAACRLTYDRDGTVLDAFTRAVSTG